MTARELVGRTLYGTLFVVVLPVMLVVWADATSESVTLPAIGSRTFGWVTAVGGGILMVAGMLAIWRHGGGLPMNAYPPSRFVRQGAYRVVAHPIYAGFSVLVVGVAVLARSRGGLWLVAPTVILGCVALVVGYEREDLRRRFGDVAMTPIVHLAPRTARVPAWSDRLSAYVVALLPWYLLGEALRAIAATVRAAPAPWAVAIDPVAYASVGSLYASRHALILTAPAAPMTTRDLRELVVCGLIATAIGLVLVVGMPFRGGILYDTRDALGAFLAWDRSPTDYAAAMRVPEMVWTYLAAFIWARSAPRLRYVAFAWASLVAVGGVAAGTETVLDVVAAAIVFVCMIRRQWMWELTRSLTERIANSWREWRLGPLRVINHGLYAGAAALLGVSIVGTLLGPSSVAPTLMVGISAAVGAAVWGQLVEGSPSLLRPYGWYGGMLGVVIGTLIAGRVGADPWLLLAAFSVAAPWVQSTGRLRCLVQGCCHGREAPSEVGIRCTHPRSRVCRLAGLAGVPIHPTQLYSVLWNAIVGIVTARLFLAHARVTLIVGAYLILAGLGRFVEESYRGEPQTAIIVRLRLYQWLAIASALAGIVVTMAGQTEVAPEPQWGWAPIVAGAGFGAFTWFAFGVDFPGSRARFARLT